MREERIPKERALEDINILIERLALLHVAYARTLERELPPERAKELTEKAILEYGRLAAEAVTQKLEEQGLAPTLANYRLGKDLPSMGWDYGPIGMPPEKPHGKISKVTRCPLAEVWKSLGEEGLRLGRYYCWVDQAKYAAYGKGYRCLHDKNTMDGDNCCVIRVELEAPEE